MATVIGGPWLEHLNSPANTMPCHLLPTRPVMTMTSSLVTTHWGRVRLVHRTHYPALAWPINLQAYAMPSVPVPPITLLTDHVTDMVTRSRLLAAHGLASCLSVRTQPLTATGAPSQTSTMPCHAMPCHAMASIPEKWHSCAGTELESGLGPWLDVDTWNDPALHIFRLRSDVLGPSSTSDTARTVPVLISDTCVPLLWPTCITSVHERVHTSNTMAIANG